MQVRMEIIFFKSLNSSLPMQFNELDFINLSFPIGQFTVTLLWVQRSRTLPLGRAWRVTPVPSDAW